MMLPDTAHSGSRFSNELVHELTDKEFRHEYMMDKVRSYIAFQIRALREQRRWNQGDLAKAAGKTQSVISRLEDPDYGKLSLQSCLELAVAYDLPLLVQFVEWDDWLARMSNMSPSALRKRSFDANRLIEANRRMDLSAAAAAGDFWRSTDAGNANSLSGFVARPAAGAANTNSSLGNQLGGGGLIKTQVEGIAA